MSTTTLSIKAIEDLRIALQKTYGDDFCIALSDEQINHIGVLVLTGITEGLKVEIQNTQS